jgi:hypothetical protein
VQLNYTGKGNLFGVVFLIFSINLLKPTGYVMHHQFNIQQLYARSTLYLCVLYFSENSDLYHLHHRLIGFYYRYEKCLQRGRDWGFNKAVCASSLKG